MIITIGGTPGSGKSTLSTMLEESLKWPRFYSGQFFRDTAKRHDMEITEFLRYLEHHPEKEKDMDRDICSEIRQHRNAIYEGRVAFHLVPFSLKVFICCDIQHAARRIFSAHDARRNEKYSSFDHALVSLQDRMDTDTKRYRELYGIDIYDTSHYSIIIDTSDLDVEQAYAQLVQKLIQSGVHQLA